MLKLEVNWLIRQSLNGTPEWIRTTDLLLRRQTLYPAELRAHIPGAALHCIQIRNSQRTRPRHTRKAAGDTCAWTRCNHEIGMDTAVYHINSVDAATKSKLWDGMYTDWARQLNSPNRVLTSRATVPWWKVRIGPSSASTSGTDTSLFSTPAYSGVLPPILESVLERRDLGVLHPFPLAFTLTVVNPHGRRPHRGWAGHVPPHAGCRARLSQ